MEEYIRDIFGKPLDALPTFIDIGRLSKRINVVIQNDENSLKRSDSVKDCDPTVRNYIPSVNLTESYAYYLAIIIKKVLLYVEPECDSKKLLIAVDKFEKDAADSLDLQVYVKELFKNFDAESSTTKIFKMINQAALSSAVTAIKLNVAQAKSSLPYEKRMTKDVRTSDGWRVIITLSPNEICISHIRKEQGLGQPISPDYWDISWRLDIYFSSDMSTLLHATITIIEMNFGEDIPIEMKMELDRLYHSIDFKQAPIMIKNNSISSINHSNSIYNEDDINNCCTIQ